LLVKPVVCGSGIGIAVRAGRRGREGAAHGNASCAIAVGCRVQLVIGLLPA
jgi:hypothetical protein